jgi:hypothetical protein
MKRGCTDVELTRYQWVDGEAHDKGTILSQPTWIANGMIADGRAIEVTDKKTTTKPKTKNERNSTKDKGTPEQD